MKDTCHPQRVLLAEGPYCKVEGCDCGTMHVSLGPITLRLRAEVVESVWRTLDESLVRFGRARERVTRAPRERFS
ncbi:MAG: hypothetical protein KF764_14790 [Labilithrix sp.]|nr:hypothetical protein [Labilithrix sp.]MBX3222544.1 hypothetical protein [Labilithrix sp.]